jgi:hypothetical protein
MNLGGRKREAKVGDSAAALHLHANTGPIVRHVGDILQTSSSEICSRDVI